MADISRQELIKVIKDFIEMGHVENIVAMFKQDKSLYELSGDILNDERFMVRIGVSVLFEELKTTHPGDLEMAVPSLLPLLASDTSYLRGEAASVLGIIGTPAALSAIKVLAQDPDPQVREIVDDILD